MRSAFATLRHSVGIGAADRARAARFRAQAAVEALQAAEQSGPSAVLLLAASSPPLAVLRSLAAACEVGAPLGPALLSDARLAALLSRLASPSPPLGEAACGEALTLVARLGLSAAACPAAAPALDALVARLAERTARTGGSAMDPRRALDAVAALGALGHVPRARSGAALTRVVAAMLRTCPSPRAKAALLRDAVTAGLNADTLAAAAADGPAAVSRPTALVAQPAPAAAGARSLALRALAPAAARGPARIRVRCAAAGGPAGSDGASGAPADAVDPVDGGAVALAFAVPALGGLAFGYDIGVTSGALVSLTSASSGTDWGPALSALQSGAVVSTSLVGAVAASCFALAFGDRLGRRLELGMAAAFYSAGAATMALAPGLAALLAGRALYGAGIGLAMHVAPIYIAETAPERLRGTLVSAKEAAIVAGILTGYVAGSAFISEPGGWRAMLGYSGAVAVLMGAGAARLAESPRWLQQRGRGRAAVTTALLQLRGAAVPRAAVEAEAARIAPDDAQPGGAAAAQSPGLASLFAPRNGRALYVGVSVMLFQQVTGQPSVLYYAVDILRNVGFDSDQAAAEASVLLGTFKLLMTLVAVATVDRLGRRPLLLGGVAALTAALLLLAALSFPALSPLEGAPAAYAAAAALMLYVGAYQLSFGPIAWLLVGEVFPAECRSAAVGLATVVNFSSNAAVSFAVPLLNESVGQGGTYALFACLGAVALLSIYATVPETKGKSLEQIEAAWRAQ